MEIETLQECWKELCSLLFENVKDDINEKEYEDLIVRVAEKMGWHENEGEIKRQLKINIGRNQHIIIDIVISDSNGKALIVIEVKRPKEDLSTNLFANQLNSYMRQMKAEFGLLIGNQIHLYYDGNLNTQPKPIMIEKYEFNRNSGKGIEFVRFFNKSSFNSTKSMSYIEGIVEKFKKNKRLIKRNTSPKNVHNGKSKRMYRVYSEIIPELKKMGIEYKVNDGKESVTLKKVGDYFKLFLSPRDDGLYTLAIFSKIKQVPEALKDFRFSVEPKSTNSFRRARIPMAQLEEIIDSIKRYFEKNRF